MFASLVEDPRLVSNSITICLQINDQFKGQWKLPNMIEPESDGFTENEPAIEEMSSSRITSGVFISPNDIEVTSTIPAASVSVGATVQLIGTSFPVQPELALSIYIVKIGSDNRIVAVQNITADSTVIDSTTIEISSMPSPPTGELGVNYWLAVAGFDPAETVRRTAIEVTIN